MSRHWLFLAVLVTTGCHHASAHRPPAGPCPPPTGACPPAAADACQPTGPCADGPCQLPPVCLSKPEVEVTGGGKDVHVHVPKQKVLVPRRGGGAGPAAAGGQAVTQEQLVQTRQVILMPQQVLVPFVQTTATGPIRVSGLQETQVTNTTTATAAIAAAQGVVTTGTATAASGTGAAPAAANPQSLPECIALLREYEQKVQRLTTVAESLEKQVEALKANVPPAPK